MSSQYSMKQIKNTYKLTWIKRDNDNPPKEYEPICFLNYKHNKWWFGIGYLEQHIYPDDINKPENWRVEEGFEEWCFWKDIRYWCYRKDFMNLILDKEIIKFE